MSSPLEVLQRLPEARTETVADLVHYAEEGRIRIPDFQRALNWATRDVLDLFDSIYRGLPVGSLLLWKRRGEADRLHLGPLDIWAPELAEAWWVVDGQQRLTSLAAALLRTLPLPTSPDSRDPFVVYFDPARTEFSAPKKTGEVPPEWVPLPALLDAARLSEWVHEWELGKNRELRQRVFDAGRRIREYKVPLYLVETAQQEILQEIFYRVNKTGRPLKWPEVHDALYGTSTGPPSTTRQLLAELTDLGMGRLDPSTITTCLLALRGLDVTRTLSEHRLKDRDVLRGAVADALPVLRQALAFLRQHASIPHLRLLPKMMVLEVLTRFFAVHPEPNSRSRTLLARWVWRALLGDPRLDERTLERRAIAAVTDDEEGTIQAMLSLVPRERPNLSIPDTFDARTSGTRVALLALASLGPRDLRDGRLIDVAELIEDRQADAFAFITRRGAVRGPENRMLHPASGQLKPVILNRIRENAPDDDVLRSHAIDEPAAIALATDLKGFYQFRNSTILHTLNSLGDRFAAWGRDNDRPSLQYLLAQEPKAADV